MLHNQHTRLTSSALFRHPMRREDGRTECCPSYASVSNAPLIPQPVPSRWHSQRGQSGSCASKSPHTARLGASQPRFGGAPKGRPASRSNRSAAERISIGPPTEPLPTTLCSETHGHPPTDRSRNSAQFTPSNLTISLRTQNEVAHPWPVWHGARWASDNCGTGPHYGKLTVSFLSRLNYHAALWGRRGSLLRRFTRLEWTCPLSELL